MVRHQDRDNQDDDEVLRDGQALRVPTYLMDSLQRSVMDSLQRSVAGVTDRIVPVALANGGRLGVNVSAVRNIALGPDGGTVITFTNGSTEVLLDPPDLVLAALNAADAATVDAAAHRPGYRTGDQAATDARSLAYERSVAALRDGWRSREQAAADREIAAVAARDQATIADAQARRDAAYARSVEALQWKSP